MEVCHDHKTAGHYGQEKTVLRVKELFHWHHLRRDVFLYVSTCAVCSVSKKACRKPVGPLQSYHASMPLERVHIDVLGPFVESRRGNKLILVLVDQFTKWVECYPIPDQTAEVVCRELITNFISRFGVPQQIHSDQGRNF